MLDDETLPECDDAVGQLLSHLGAVEIDELVGVDSELVIVARIRSRQAGCQACAAASSRVHSRYCRTLEDAPVRYPDRVVGASVLPRERGVPGKDVR